MIVHRLARLMVGYGGVVRGALRVSRTEYHTVSDTPRIVMITARFCRARLRPDPYRCQKASSRERCRRRRGCVATRARGRRESTRTARIRPGSSCRFATHSERSWTPSATVLRAERQLTGVKIRPASVIFEDALADAAVVGVSDEQQGAVLTIEWFCDSHHQDVVADSE